MRTNIRYEGKTTGHAFQHFRASKRDSALVTDPRVVLRVSCSDAIRCEEFILDGILFETQSRIKKIFCYCKNKSLKSFFSFFFIFLFLYNLYIYFIIFFFFDFA